jgi:predicted ATPase/DNA-binding winged helix-turn-helix (wHTH) protein
MGAQEAILSFGDFRLLPSRHQLLEGDREVRVGSRALGLLELLVQRAGDTVGKQELMEAVWGGAWVDEANLRANIGALRKLLGDGRDGRRFIVNVPGRGYRFVEPVTASGEPAIAPRPNGERAPALSALPVAPRLVGRTEAVLTVNAQLAGRRLVTVTGVGGIGKTSVALAVADVWARAHNDPTVFIDLTAITGLDQLWTSAARALGHDATPNPRAQVIRSIRSHSHVIVLDNCEHVIADAAEFAATVLKSSASVRILATSREPLRVHDEWVCRLPPLDAPDRGADTTASDAMEHAAVQLLVERVSATRGGYELNDRDAPFAAEICRSLDGNALAIELAAAQAEAFSMEQLAEGLRDRFTFLSKGRRGAAARHQSLYAALDWSYQLLGSDERALLGSLSVFPIWFEISDAVALGTALAMPATLVSDCLGSLVTKSTVVASIRSEGGQYRLQESVRAFARLRLEQADEAKVFQTFTAHVTQALSSDPTGNEAARSEWLARCTRHIENTRACLDWSIGHGTDLTAGVDLILKALPFWTVANQLNAHRIYLEAARGHLRTARPRRRADELAIEIAIGLAGYFAAGPVPEVADQFRHALDLARKFGSKSQVLNILWSLYGVVGNWGDYPAQLRFAKEFGAASARMRDARIQARRHRMLARAHHDYGEQKAAAREIKRALIAPLPVSPARLDAYSIDDGVAARAIQCRILWVTGAVDDATALADECLDRCLAIDHASLICWAISLYLCPIAIWTGDMQKAHRLASIAMTHSEKALVHWNAWARQYQLLLREPAAPAPAELVREMLPAQRGLFATLSPVFVTAHPDPQTAHRKSWYAPEVMRRAAEARSEDQAGTAIRHLRQAEVLATSQGALSWRLRIATTLGQRYLLRGENAKVGAVLAPVYRSFKQGFGTQDLQRAASLLAEA